MSPHRLFELNCKTAQRHLKLAVEPGIHTDATFLHTSTSTSTITGESTGTSTGTGAGAGNDNGRAAGLSFDRVRVTLGFTNWQP